MYFIKGFIHSNPIDAAKRDRIIEITKEVMGVFAKQYLLATKDVVLEEAEEKVAKLEKKKEKWERKHAKRERKRAEHGLPPGNEVWDPEHAFDKKPYEELKRICLEDLNSGLRCKRPRDKDKAKKPKPRKIKPDIIGHVMFDADIDPYVSYIVTATVGCQESERFRRYTQFKVLNKAVGKKYGCAKLFPPASSLWGGRNLTNEFIHERQKQLVKFLKEMCKGEGADQDPDVLAFFGLSKIDDPVSLEIEKRTIAATLHELCLGWVYYDGLTDGMAKIVIIKIRAEMWDSILQECPPSEKARRACMRLACKTLDTLVYPLVESGIHAAKEASAPVRQKLNEKLVELATVAVQAKHDVQNKLCEAMSSALSPVVGAMSQLVGRLTADLLPCILRPLVNPIQQVVGTMEQLIDVFATGDESRVDQLKDAIKAAIDGIGDKITESMKDAVANLVGDRDKLVMNPALNGIMVLLEVFVDIVKDVIMVIFNLEPWFACLKAMMHFKAKLLKADPSDPEKIYDLCDDEYDDVKDTIEDNSGDFMIGARVILHAFEALPGKAGLLSGVLGELFEDIRDVILDKFFKRFGKKYTDYIWGTLNLASDTRDWKTKCDHSFALAFRSAVRHAMKGISAIAVNRIVGILETPILSAIEEYVTPMIHDALEPINKALPEAVAEFIDVEGMVNTVIEHTVHDSCTRIVKDQESVFKQEFTVCVGFVYGAPFMPTYPPFPYVYVAGPNDPVVAAAAGQPMMMGQPGAPMMMADPNAAMMMGQPGAPMMGQPMMMGQPGAPMMGQPVDPNTGYPMGAAAAPVLVETAPVPDPNAPAPVC